LVCHTIVIGLPPLLRPSLLFGSNREAGGVRRACCRTRSSPLRRAILKSVAEAEVVPKDPRRRAHSRSQVVTPVTAPLPSHPRHSITVRIPMIPYTQSDVFGRGRRRPRSGRRLGAYPVSSPPSRCLIDSLQALELAVERVMIRLDFAQGKWFHCAVHGLSSTGVGPSLARPA
jgi:hypothetical protein